MSGVKKYDYTTIKQAILDYTEVDDSVFTTTILDGFIMAAEFRIYQELPMDAQRNVQEGTLAANDNTINAPAGYNDSTGSPATTTTQTGFTFELVSNASSTETGGGFQCTIGPINDRA